MDNQQARNHKDKKRVMIVDGHAMTRIGLHQVISNDPNFEICAETVGISETMQCLGMAHPDLLVAEIALKDGSGLTLIEQILKMYPAMKILVFSLHDETLFADRALRAGAMGYVGKGEAPEKIIEGLHQLLAGKIYLSEDMSERILNRRLNSRNGREASFTDNLSNRELEIFQLIGKGKIRSQLAAMLHLSVKTIETHQENIKRKLNLRSNQEMVCRAVQWVLENNNGVASHAMIPDDRADLAPAKPGD